MKHSMIVSGWRLGLVMLVSFGLVANPAFAKAPIKLENWSGTIDLSTEETSSFTLEGSASHLGQFRAYGEIDFVPGEGDSLLGEGVVVFEAANGDLLVGVTTWDVGAEADDFRPTAIHFSWRDFVELSDGTIVASTGRFANAADRPSGLVVIAIIAILFPLLLPAVQKV